MVFVSVYVTFFTFWTEVFAIDSLLNDSGRAAAEVIMAHGPQWKMCCSGGHLKEVTWAAGCPGSELWKWDFILMRHFGPQKDHVDFFDPNFNSLLRNQDF